MSCIIARYGRGINKGKINGSVILTCDGVDKWTNCAWTNGRPTDGNKSDNRIHLPNHRRKDIKSRSDGDGTAVSSVSRTRTGVHFRLNEVMVVRYLGNSRARTSGRSDEGINASTTS